MLKEICEILNIDIEDVESYDNGVLVLNSGEEYLVFSDYDDAYEAAVRSAEDIFEDVGVDVDHLSQFFNMSEYIDTDWFDDALRESMEYYVEDIANEWESDDHTRLYHEMVDAGIIDEIDDDDDEEYITDREKEDFIDYLVEQQGDGVEWYRFNFGDSDFNSVIIDKGLIDLHKLAEGCVDIDGVEHFLASYDGNEISDGTFYIYRIN